MKLIAGLWKPHLCGEVENENCELGYRENNKDKYSMGYFSKNLNLFLY